MVMLQSGHFNGGKIFITDLVSVGRENGYVTEVDSLLEGEWLCYRVGLFNGGRMVMLWRWPL